MHWLALLLTSPPPTDEDGERTAARQQALAWWALQFSPRVARLEESVVLEVQASLKLFGGAAALHRRIWRGAREAGLALSGIAWAPTSLGALALARGGVVRDGLSQPLAPLLDALPLHTLSAVQAHAPMLQRLGCRTLGEVRRLPRGASAKRFDPALLLALDRAHGHIAQAHQWEVAPETFAARLELPHRIEHAPVLLHHAQHLLTRLCAWLAARHAGIRALTLHWQHDAMRARDVDARGSLSWRTAETTRDFGHLSRLLAEHLARIELAAPVDEISLAADEVMPLTEGSLSLLPASPDQAKEPLPQLLERIAVRLGPESVRVGRLHEDHRPEHMQRWDSWPGPPRPRVPARVAAYPQPNWLLDPPLRLEQRREQPLFCGPLQRVAGPQRIEEGWWQPGEDGSNSHVQRDYFVYRSEQAGLLWVYQQRLSKDEHGWFLHGVYA
ncbi:DNA polymerase Y family protein [Pelomonas sp. KK5]|uniref:Y-family DNA polymerase n=1 Tax=Pelomonas sp. KK5 TaxID=1855730 RepID=UPI00097BE32F|nr:DNA polymerase Y family protein [Pelomonas sp. KK5]